jgi:hypothetical protein
MEKRRVHKPATSTVADLVGQTEAGQQVLAEVKASIESRYNQLTGLVQYVFVKHPTANRKPWNVRKDVLPSRVQYLRWVAEGKTRVSFSDLSMALKSAYTGPSAYAEACRLLGIDL